MKNLLLKIRNLCFADGMIRIKEKRSGFVGDQFVAQIIFVRKI